MSKEEILIEVGGPQFTSGTMSNVGICWHVSNWLECKRGGQLRFRTCDVPVAGVAVDDGLM